MVSGSGPVGSGRFSKRKQMLKWMIDLVGVESFRRLLTGVPTQLLLSAHFAKSRGLVNV